MFLITYEDEVHRQWSLDFVFEDFKEAKDYLLKKVLLRRIDYL